MGFSYLLLSSLCVLFLGQPVWSDGFVTWGNNHYQTWGNPALVLNQTSELQLTLNNRSGSGFESVLIYGSGVFDMNIKTPDKNSKGVVTSFYLMSRSSRHDEFSFELFGSDGRPYTLTTNMYLYGGGKEMIFRLWFDPTKDYHSYKLLWNQHHVVFYVDDTPIRVFKKRPEVYYPSVQTMFIIGSIKNQNVKTISSKMASFRASKIDGCVTTFFDTQKCTDSKFWWNQQQYWELNPKEQKLYEKAKKTYMYYDYCSDRKRYPQQPPECKNYL